MSTPISSPSIKRRLNGTPKSTISTNLYQSSEGNNNFVNNYLCKNIPILKDKELFDYVLNYCYQLKNYTKSNKDSHLKQGIIKEINSKLTQIKNNYEKINSINSENNIINRNNKIIKRHKLSANGLIEGIINCILHYYSDNSTINSNLKISQNNHFYQIMNKANGISLENFIIELYNSNENNKDLLFLNVLKAISEKLDYLQNNYNFIHGDFHSGNIFVYLDKNNIIDITFIDFGYTTINFPFKNNLLISGITESNLQRRNELNLKEEPLLKAIDLFHLIQNLKSFELSNKLLINKKIYNKLNSFFILINKIQNIYFKNFDKKILTNYKTNHFFTSSNEFFSRINYNNNSSFEILIPSNFIKKIDTLLNNNLDLSIKNNYMQLPKQKSLFGINNNNYELTESKRLFGNNNSELPKKKSKSIFGNNNNSELPKSKSIFGNNNSELPKQKSLFGNNNNSELPKPKKRLFRNF